jgi:hypothetical protein
MIIMTLSIIGIEFEMEVIKTVRTNNTHERYYVCAVH